MVHIILIWSNIIGKSHKLKLFNQLITIKLYLNMLFLDFVFNLSIVYVIFNFIWWFLIKHH